MEPTKKEESEDSDYEKP